MDLEKVANELKGLLAQVEAEDTRNYPPQNRQLLEDYGQTLRNTLASVQSTHEVLKKSMPVHRLMGERLKTGDLARPIYSMRLTGEVP